MLTQNKAYDSGSKFDGNPQEFYALSTDPEPTVADHDLINGAVLYIIDKGNIKMWDEENEEWKAQ